MNLLKTLRSSHEQTRLASLELPATFRAEILYSNDKGRTMLSRRY